MPENVELMSLLRNVTVNGRPYDPGEVSVGFLLSISVGWLLSNILNLSRTRSLLPYFLILAYYFTDAQCISKMYKESLRLFSL